MSKSAWRSELLREGVEHYLPEDYLQTVLPSVINYGVEVELPRVCRTFTAVTFTIAHRFVNCSYSQPPDYGLGDPRHRSFGGSSIAIFDSNRFHSSVKINP